MRSSRCTMLMGRIPMVQMVAPPRVSSARNCKHVKHMQPWHMQKPTAHATAMNRMQQRIACVPYAHAATMTCVQS
eukprot:357606-Chlamydomonas_euryale.AAC.10